MKRLVVVDDNYLAHHGVKGQKWGVRKDESSDNPNTEPYELETDSRKQIENQEKQQKEKRNKTIRNIVLGVGLTAIGISIVERLLRTRFSDKSSKNSNTKTRTKKSAHIPGSSWKDVYGKGHNDPYVKKGKTIVDAYGSIPLIAIKSIQRR